MHTRHVVRVLSLSFLAVVSPTRTHAQDNLRLSAFKSEASLRDYFRDLARDRLKLSNDRLAASCGAELKVARKKSRLNSTIVVGLVTASGGRSPLQGAQVAAPAFQRAAPTGADGRFRLVVPTQSSKESILIAILAIGYNARRFHVTPGDSVEIIAPMCVSPFALEEIVVSGVAEGQTSVTNTQHAGVDEGGIVKLHGSHLVILRRGRLFTVAVGDSSLHPVASVNAYGPGLDPRGTWYDEMLVYRDKVVVVGYSYLRGGTELGIFRIDSQGGLRYQDTWQMRSNDYYSSRNYASRLIGSRLVFYTPFYVGSNVEDPLGVLPAMRRWGPDKEKGRFERLVTPQTVWHSDRTPKPEEVVVVHSVTVCDLNLDSLPCAASAVVGTPERSFYVSQTSVYVWTGPPGFLVRFGFGGPPGPGILAVEGNPIDQFSFLEEDDGTLNVLVQSRGRGEGMWRAERAVGDLSLLRVPRAEFGPALRQARQAEYRELPRVTGVLHNRFVGTRLLYGTGNSWGRASEDAATLFVVPVTGGSIKRFSLPHGADRIEPMGRDAAVIGQSDNDLVFTGVSLGDRPDLVQRFTMHDVSQGELRSHGFFYRPDGGSGGLFGLPFRGEGEEGWTHILRGSAGVVFVENRDNRFTPLGTLEARPDTGRKDDCKASCVDWYGNARPLFVGKRVFALMGYEIVEGAVMDGRIREVRRLDFLK